ncbi:unnamed protein product [Pleuronectes platessa]|uniref:Uncharacterized protein n=1 Tax=Pleuronectes platessa TaxID=8262 RepID=A0A9N7UV80_PLEPL|nr:unnamed protein product [Pleuronectes platessa]
MLGKLMAGGENEVKFFQEQLPPPQLGLLSILCTLESPGYHTFSVGRAARGNLGFSDLPKECSQEELGIGKLADLHHISIADVVIDMGNGAWDWRWLCTVLV